MGNKGTAQNGSKVGAGGEAFSLISNEKLIALYANLLKCRMAGDRVGANTNGSKGFMRAYEAGAVGVAIDLGSGDTVCAPQHGFLTALSVDAPMQTILLMSGHSGGLGGVDLSPTNSNSPHRNAGSAGAGDGLCTHAAIGTALANKTTKNGKVAIVFFTDETSGPEWWKEALKIASVHGLPMVFVSHSQWEPDRTVRRNRAPDTEEAPYPGSSWFPAITVDSNDVVAVYRVANEAITRARQGRGPTLIECRHFRMHRERANGNKSDRDGSHGLDSILNMEQYLRGKGLFSPALRSEILAGFTRELDLK